MTGCYCLFSYYCPDEEKGKNWVSEERKEDDKPTVCKNDPKHEIKLDSITVVGKYVKLKQINQINNYDECDLTKINLLNVHEKCELLAQRVRILEEILNRMNQLQFV